MLKVFLVEDEVVMREGIKNNINWEQEGFSFVGEASDGELAYPLIQKTRPDILITDIKMPFMDGLELSRLVKQELPDVKIIILSGYDEFDYAKEAISIGITDYLVKPIAGAQLLEAVKKVGAKVEEEREQQRKYLEMFEKERLENTQLARQKFFRRLVSGQSPVSVLLKEGRKAGMDLAAKRYNIILFQIFAEGAEEGYSEKLIAVTRSIEEMTDQMPEVLMVELGLEGWAFILKEEEENSLEEIETGLLDGLKEVLSEAGGVTYFGGVGQEVERLSELGRCFEEASRAFAFRYLTKRNQIVRSSEAATGEVDQEMALNTLSAGKLDRRVVENFLKTGLKSEAVHFVDEYFASLGEKNIQSLMFRQYVTMDTYFAAAGMLEESGCEPGILVERCGDFQKIPEVFSTSEATEKYLKKVLETAIELREGLSRQKYSSLLKDARSYIEENYDNEDISLNTVAASVNLSPNHFSTIFSQETGRTFIEYLTYVRMEKAKELLRGTSMKTAEIAFAVGYKDPHYFSYLFKKTIGCTPREFRARV